MRQDTFASRGATVLALIALLLISSPCVTAAPPVSVDLTLNTSAIDLTAPVPGASAAATGSSVTASNTPLSLSGSTSSVGVTPGAVTATVTYILSLNDNGSGVATPGSYAVYAVDSKTDGNGGLVGFSVDFTGETTISAANKNGAPYGYYDDGTGSGSDVEIGFSAGRASATTGSVAKANLTGAQDTLGANGVPYVAVYGFGQTASTSAGLAAYEPTNSTGLDTSMGHTTSQTYNAQMLLATGTFTGAGPSFITGGVDGANVWTNSTGTGITNLPAANIILTTQNLIAVPEPTSVGLMLIGFAGLALTRRRRSRDLANAA